MGKNQTVCTTVYCASVSCYTSRLPPTHSTHTPYRHRHRTHTSTTLPHQRFLPPSPPSLPRRGRRRGWARRLGWPWTRRLGVEVGGRGGWTRSGNERGRKRQRLWLVCGGGCWWRWWVGGWGVGGGGESWEVELVIGVSGGARRREGWRVVVGAGWVLGSEVEG